VRLSLYVQEGGYETDPEGFRGQVDLLVDQISRRGMYVLLDWHMLNPGDPWENLDLAREYFSAMAKAHGARPNVLYEICNEPSKVSWENIKSYAEEFIPLIRKQDPDSVVIVGTRDWSSFGMSGDGEPGEVLRDPVRAENLLYSFHFYAASHGAEYRTGLRKVLGKLPIFVTEWGSQEYTGDGENDFEGSQEYLDLFRKFKVSWTSWNYSDDSRSGAAWKPGTCPGGPWTVDRLKPAGKWVRQNLLNPPDDFGG
jgi:endoglucanase